MRECELGDTDATGGELGQCLRYQLRTLHLRPDLVGFGTMVRFAEHRLQDGLGRLALRGIGQFQMQREGGASKLARRGYLQ